jgi:hypothetical protein
MGRTTGTIGWIPVLGQHDLSPLRLRTANGGIEVLHLEPQRDAVAVGARRGIANLAVMVLDIEGMQLEHKRAVANQSLVLVATVPALAPEKLLVEAAAPHDIRHRDQRLGTHGREV